MKQKVELNKKVYDKNNYQKTINTAFSELLPPTSPEEETSVLTTEQFFQAYDELFFEIPKTGVNSHNTLIQQSKEYVGDEQKDEELEALVQEVNSLRIQLLETQQQLTEAQQTQTQLATNSLNVQSNSK